MTHVYIGVVEKGSTDRVVPVGDLLLRDPDWQGEQSSSFKVGRLSNDRRLVLFAGIHEATHKKPSSNMCAGNKEQPISIVKPRATVYQPYQPDHQCQQLSHSQTPSPSSACFPVHLCEIQMQGALALAQHSHPAVLLLTFKGHLERTSNALQMHSCKSPAIQ